MHLSLPKDESIIQETSLRYSFILFFLRPSYVITNKRLVGEFYNLFLRIIPTGKDNITYPLNNVAGVQLSTNFSVKEFFLGLVIALVGLFSVSHLLFFSLILILIGIIAIINSFKTIIIFQNNSNTSISQQVLILDKNKAKEFINHVNNTIAERL